MGGAPSKAMCEPPAFNYSAGSSKMPHRSSSKGGEGAIQAPRALQAQAISMTR